MLTSEQNNLIIEDVELFADQLDDKYNPEGDGEHPVYTRADWRAAVQNEETISGYWQWVEWRIEVAYRELRDKQQAG